LESTQSIAAHPQFRPGHERELLPFANGVDAAFVARLKKAA
jgi:hypothetical protein